MALDRTANPRSARRAGPRPLALYARHSTADQSAEAQLHALRAYASRRGCEVVEYVDEGVSGAKDRRPQLDAMMRAVRRREVSAVVAIKLDRLARSVRHLTTLAGELEALDVGLVVLDQDIDTSTPTGRLLFHVLGSIAEFERDLVRERTRAGLESAKRRGARLGRPPAADASTRARIHRLRSSGKSLRAIAAATGVSVSTVGRTLNAAGAVPAGSRKARAAGRSG